MKDTVDRVELEKVLRGSLKDVLHGLSKKVEFQDVEALKHHTDERVSDLQSKVQLMSRELACARAEAADSSRVADLVRAVQSKADQDDIEVSLQRKVQKMYPSIISYSILASYSQRCKFLRWTGHCSWRHKTGRQTLRTLTPLSDNSGQLSLSRLVV